jgi:DNA-binding winged helix-turn-helix (wHTH) protein
MDVNSFRNAFTGRAAKLIATMMVFLGAIFLLAAFVTDRSGGEVISKRANIAVRAIGHELLLRAGDSTSRVRPVIEKPNGVFLLEFENEFVFQPDTLVAIVRRVLDKTTLSRYTVTVHECHRPAIVYGFEINPPANNIEACQGRSQPKACYNIEIAFADFSDTTNSNVLIAMMLVGALSVLAVVLIGRNFGIVKSKRGAEPSHGVPDIDSQNLTIGKFVFDATHQRLKLGAEIIPLTDKECKILTLLNKNIGQLTLRDDLVQEVWTDEGVITGRSLDMFISKLRKKLSGDPDLRITNVHGKGYKLEIEQD